MPRHGNRPTTAIGRVMHGVVQIVALRQSFLGGLTSAWTGSGTVVHPSGFILTNCHVADPRAMGTSAPPADRLGIAVNDRSDKAPAMSYFANTETKSDGSFTLPDQLAKGNAYSLIAAADGYRPMTVEGALRVGPGAPERADIGSIQLVRTS